MWKLVETLRGKSSLLRGETGIQNGMEIIQEDVVEEAIGTEFKVRKRKERPTNLPIKYYDPQFDADPPSESEPPSSIPYLGLLSESLVQHNALVELNSPVETAPTPMRVISGGVETKHVPKESTGDTVVFINHHQPGPSILSGDPVISKV